jgi:hypothetical protein
VGGTDRQAGDLTSPLSFFESMLKRRTQVIKSAALYNNPLLITEPKWKNLQKLWPLGERTRIWIRAMKRYNYSRKNNMEMKNL